MQTCTLINIQLKKEDHLQPAELWKFDWDHKPETEKELSDEEILEHNRHLAAMLD